MEHPTKLVLVFFYIKKKPPPLHHFSVSGQRNPKCSSTVARSTSYPIRGTTSHIIEVNPPNFISIQVAQTKRYKNNHIASTGKRKSNHHMTVQLHELNVPAKDVATAYTRRCLYITCRVEVCESPSTIRHLLFCSSI